MSYWTYITGVITVHPMGRTQPEKRYILDTVLEHLPKVTGSEKDMHIHVIQRAGYNHWSGCNEFGACIPHQDYKMQDEYLLIIEASLRDRTFDETKLELNKWLNRLAKRVGVEDILVQLSAYDRKLIISDAEPYSDMFEWPSWSSNDGEPTWCEYLMWDSGKDFDYPMLLAYKYYNDPENDAEVERRMAYDKGE